MKKVLILFGGNSNEHEISCKSCKSILKNIDYNLFDVTTVGITKDNKWYIYKDDIELIDKWTNNNILEIENIITFLKQFDIVLSVIHGNGGEDGKLQGMLDMFNIKYVGPKVLSSSIGMDKEYSKIIFNSVGIPQVPYIVLKEKYNLKDIIKIIGFPSIIKPCNGGSSIGISLAYNKKELINGINKAFKYDSKVIIEKFINGMELEIAILEDKKIITSSIGEIIPANAFYDYDAKYNSNSKTIIPADIPKIVKEKIENYAIKAFKALECSDLSRIDFFYDKDNDNIYLNEINTSPGFTEISMYPMLLIDNGYSYKNIITTLLKKRD